MGDKCPYHDTLVNTLTESEKETVRYSTSIKHIVESNKDLAQSVRELTKGVNKIIANSMDRGTCEQRHASMNERIAQLYKHSDRKDKDLKDSFCDRMNRLEEAVDRDIQSAKHGAWQVATFVSCLIFGILSFVRYLLS